MKKVGTDNENSAHFLRVCTLLVSLAVCVLASLVPRAGSLHPLTGLFSGRMRVDVGRVVAACCGKSASAGNAAASTREFSVVHLSRTSNQVACGSRWLLGLSRSRMCIVNVHTATISVAESAVSSKERAGTKCNFTWYNHRACHVRPQRAHGRA